MFLFKLNTEAVISAFVIINDDSYKKLMGITISEQMCVALNMLPFFLSFFLLFLFLFFFLGGGGRGL